MNSDSKGDEESTTQTVNNYGFKYRPVLGGVLGYSEAPETFTYATPAKHDILGDVLLTVAHGFDQQSGLEAVQDDVLYGDVIGYSNEMRYDLGYGFDAAVVSLNSSVDTEYYLADDGQDSWSHYINGRITEDRLHWMWDNNYPMQRQGITSGRESGYITDIDSGGEYFRTDANSDDGDSGGPHYEQFGDTVYISGVHRGRPFLNAEATFIGAVEDELNVTVEGTVWDAP